jgi:hypothetical protein
MVYYSEGRSIQETLWDMFVRDDFRDPQDRQYIWATYEGLKRIDPLQYRFKETKAQKDHECERGCLIKNGDKYYQHIVGAAWGSELKLCAGCMAMILYFLDMEKYRPYIYTHWHFGKQEPIKLQEAVDEWLSRKSTQES